MPNRLSTSNQNTRVFAPHVILKQDTNRLALTLRNGEGYTLPAFIAGDVIRYDPTDLSYKLSQADTEENAEVVGVVESVGSSITVVVSGSIQYPTAKLDAILDGGVGGKDVLFLSDEVAGGLTGTINLDDGTVKIVKPVLQLAPNSGYNAVVINYIGYKTGSAASGSGDSPFTSGVIFGPRGLDTDIWLNLENDVLLDVGDYPGVYSAYGTSNGPWRETLTVSSGSVTSAGVGDQIYQLTPGGAKQNTGTVISVDTFNSTITIEKSANTNHMNVSNPVYVSGIPLAISGTETTGFTVPKIETNNSITQNDETLVPYLKINESSSVNIPSELAINQLTVANNVAVGSITDLEAKIQELENKINLLNSKVSAF